MKPFTSAFLVLLAAATSASSQPSENFSPPANTAHILGDIPDGTPPPPEPPKPEFIVPTKDILESETHKQGGREITIQKITPIDLPPPPEAPAPIAINDPALLKRIAARRAKYPDRKLLLLGATVYHSKDTPPRTLVQIWPQAEGKPITFWSSADFSLLSGLPSFTIATGETTSLMMTWSITDIDHTNALQRKYARQFTPPKIPVFPSGNATFIVTEGTPT
jgi:hypothetical protein